MLLMLLRSPFMFMLQWGVIVLTSLMGFPAMPNDGANQIYLPLILRQLPIIPKTEIWIANATLANLPMTGPAWENLQATAAENAGIITLSDQDTDANVKILAKALVYVRTKATHYRSDVRTAIEVITWQNTEDKGRVLA